MNAGVWQMERSCYRVLGAERVGRGCGLVISAIKISIAKEGTQKMKALSIKPLWATLILQEVKRIEWRSWSTDYRGPLLICASSGPWYAGSICKHALCIVDLVDSLMDEVPEEPGYAWLLGEPCFIKPFEVKGKLKLYDVDDDLIEDMDPNGSFVEFAEKYYKPLMRWEDREVKRDEVEAAWADWMELLKKCDEEQGRAK